MATLLSRIFGKKTVETAPVQIDNNELDTRSLKPLMEWKAPVSTDPKDLSGAWTMEQVTTVFPSAQRALFQKYHIGGCSSCGFQPTDTLSTVALNHGLEVNEVIDHIKKSQDMEKDLEITPKETAELLKQAESNCSMCGAQRSTQSRMWPAAFCSVRRWRKRSCRPGPRTRSSLRCAITACAASMPPHIFAATAL